MSEKTHYVIIDCECHALQYLEQAFRMLQAPYLSCKLDKLQHNRSSNPESDIIALCKHSYANINNQLVNPPKAFLFSNTNNEKSISTTPSISLNVPFSTYEFKHALLTLSLTNDASNLHEDAELGELVGESDSIKKIKKMIRQVADSDSNILILGQSGTGKEVVASCIHQLSHRHEKPFIPLNCGAIPSELMESELFGHEKGAFTGAITKRPGRFEMANNGTLFLDEIGDMPLPMQVKLLRVIQDSKIERVGSTSSIEVNVRLIAATNKQLDEMMQNGSFREDLYYRLNVIPIYMPTLQERIIDIPILINYQLNRIRKRIPHQAVLSDDAIDAMCHYNWPGNIRELANFIERLVVLYQDKVIDQSDISAQLNKMQSKQQQFTLPHDDSFNLKEYLSTIEMKIINTALERSNGIVSTAANYLHVGRTTLIEKMKKYNMLVTE